MKMIMIQTIRGNTFYVNPEKISWMLTVSGSGYGYHDIKFLTKIVMHNDDEDHFLCTESPQEILERIAQSSEVHLPLWEMTVNIDGNFDFSVDGIMDRRFIPIDPSRICEIYTELDQIQIHGQSISPNRVIFSVIENAQEKYWYMFEGTSYEFARLINS